MAARPQDYVSDHGRLTTNTVEGFHGLALMYRSKRTDLGHVHYACKTNMAICHKASNIQKLMYMTHCTLQNHGPIWKVFVLQRMGVDIPHAAVESIVKAQEQWNKSCTSRSTKENLKKRYVHHSTRMRKYVTLSNRY